MDDNNWELINGPEAHRIEFLNKTNQINFIECLTRFALYHIGNDEKLVNWHPTEGDLLELHRIGTLFLLKRPGAYRDVHVFIGTLEAVVHTPPLWEHIPGLIIEFFEEVTARWLTSSPIEIASFCLWRLNYIHPFKNGNGRTARGFAYACLCVKYGFPLPGKETVIDLITETRDRYYAALKQIDLVYEASGAVELGPVIIYLEDLLARQLSSIEIAG